MVNMTYMVRNVEMIQNNNIVINFIEYVHILYCICFTKTTQHYTVSAWTDMTKLLNQSLTIGFQPSQIQALLYEAADATKTPYDIIASTVHSCHDSQLMISSVLYSWIIKYNLLQQHLSRVISYRVYITIQYDTGELKFTEHTLPQNPEDFCDSPLEEGLRW